MADKKTPKQTDGENQDQSEQESDRTQDNGGDIISQNGSALGIGNNSGTTNARNLGGNVSENPTGHNIYQAQQVNIYTENGERAEFDLVIKLNGITFERFLSDPEVQHAVRILLQRSSGDHSINFNSISKGSIKVSLNGSPEGLQRLARKIQSGELDEELLKLGLVAEEVKLVAKDGKPNKTKARMSLSDLGWSAKIPVVAMGILTLIVYPLAGWQFVEFRTSVLQGEIQTLKKKTENLRLQNEIQDNTARLTEEYYRETTEKARETIEKAIEKAIDEAEFKAKGIIQDARVQAETAKQQAEIAKQQAELTRTLLEETVEELKDREKQLEELQARIEKLEEALKQTQTAEPEN